MKPTLTSQDFLDFQNSSNNECLSSADPRALGSGYSRKIHFTVVGCHAFIITVSLILNGAICHVYRKGTVRKATFNALLVNLAVADIVTSLGMIPFIAVTPIMLRHLNQEVADVMCTVTVGQLIFWIGNATSIMTLCVISVNRYIVINHSMTAWDRLIKRSDIKKIMIAIPWIFGITLPLPNLPTRKFEWCSTLCSRQWPPYINGGAYSIATVFLGYVVPIGIMIYTLCASIHRLWFRPISEDWGIAVVRARKRVVVVLCTLIGVFVCWWTPFAVYWLLSTTTHVFPDGDAGYYPRTKVIYIVTMASLVNAAFNPIIYGLKSEDFRKAIKEEFSTSLRSRSPFIRTPLLWDGNAQDSA
uniref:Neuropeptide-like GPCR n=1 Tax=Tripedalia cystophora TaxID=6141 RepID=A0A481ZMS4_TRICY|nr:neuropeptide-like GPCR [Tripedalia cystophora]